MTGLEYFVILFLIVWTIFFTALMFWAMYWSYGVFRIKSRPESNNDDTKAIESALNLLSKSQAEIEIYDDGNNDANSLYNSPQLVEMIRRKLNSNPEFKVTCFFNFADDTLFKKAFVDNNRVELYFRRESSQRPENDTHYKIVDTHMAYVSKHPAGAHERRFKIIDTSAVPTRLRDKLTYHTFAKYRPAFQDFKPSVARCA